MDNYFGLFWRSDQTWLKMIKSVKMDVTFLDFGQIIRIEHP